MGYIQMHVASIDTPCTALVYLCTSHPPPFHRCIDQSEVILSYIDLGAMALLVLLVATECRKTLALRSEHLSRRPGHQP